jgi:hypothetical protein
MRSFSDFARARRAVPVGMVIAGTLLPTTHFGASATAVAHPAFQRVAYRGHSFEVPSSWRVIYLSDHRRACVRFDRHTVYLGTPPLNQECPSLLVGTTEAMLIAPASRGAAPVSVENKVARRITVVSQRMRITATFGTRPQVIDRILASAHLPRPVRPLTKASSALAAPSAATVPRLPARATAFHGRGFDTCAAPSNAAMDAWRAHSPYRAIGIYLGGSDAACAQPNLTASWLRRQAGRGWHFLPLYVGPQAAFGELTTSSARQGTAAATDAARRARRLGFGRMTPVFYDMEGYPPWQSARVLRFLSAWSIRLRALGFYSGVYSSSSSGVADLARQYGRGRYAMPDVIWDALWNGRANTLDSVFRPGQWVDHHRVHQYAGNVTQTFGGVTMNIDKDWLNVRVCDPHPRMSQTTAQRNATASPSQAVTRASGIVDAFYRGNGGGLRHLRQVPGEGWHAPADLGGRLESQPSAVTLADGRTMVIYRGTDGHLWQVRSGTAGWSQPRVLPRLGTLGGRPVAVAQHGGVDVFWKDSSGARLSFAEYRPGLGWNGPQRLGGKLASDPSPVISSSGVIHVFWKGQNGSLWQVVRRPSGLWNSPENLGAGRLGSQPQGAARPDGKIEVFWRGGNGKDVRAAIVGANGRRQGPYVLSGNMPVSAPTVVSSGGLVHVFFTGNDGLLWQVVPTRAGGWGPPPQLVASQLKSPPFAFSGPGQQRIQVLWNGPRGKLRWLSLSREDQASSPRDIGGPMP